MNNENHKFQLISKIGVLFIFSLSFIATFVNIVQFIGSFFGDGNASSILISVGNFLSNIYIYVFFLIISIIGIIGIFYNKQTLEELVIF
jgi:hypothetical protein